MRQNSYFFTGTVKSIKVIGEEYFFRFNGEPTVNDFFTKKQIVAQNVQNEKCNKFAIPEDQYFSSVDQNTLAAFIERHSHEKLRIEAVKIVSATPTPASATQADEINAALKLAKADMGKVEEEPKAEKNKEAEKGQTEEDPSEEEKDPNPSKPPYWYILSAELIDG